MLQAGTYRAGCRKIFAGFADGLSTSTIVVPETFAGTNLLFSVVT